MVRIQIPTVFTYLFSIKQKCINVQIQCWAQTAMFKFNIEALKLCPCEPLSSVLPIAQRAETWTVASTRAAPPLSSWLLFLVDQLWLQADPCSPRETDSAAVGRFGRLGLNRRRWQLWWSCGVESFGREGSCWWCSSQKSGNSKSTTYSNKLVN